jgi:imidazolonepropionase-like amidohydrolase
MELLSREEVMTGNLTRILPAAAVALLFSGSAPARAAETPKQAQQTAVLAAHLLDVRSGSLINGAVVLIEGDRIKAVGAGLAIPQEAKVIDLGGATLLPGLIDCHTHLMASSGGNFSLMLLTKSQAYRALEGASNARRTLMAGFTSVRDVESEGAGYADVALRDAINRGLVEGPRMKVATRGIAALGQYSPFGVSPDLPEFPRGAQMVSGVEEARKAVREQIGNGADLIKIYADWSFPTLTIEEMRVIVEEAHKAGRAVAAHATTTEGIRNAVNAGVDTIEHGWRADRATLEMMKQKGVWLIATHGYQVDSLVNAKDDATRKSMSEAVKSAEKTLQTARALGVKMAAGYDPFESQMHGANARELAALTSAGFTNLEAIRAATINAAELLGWEVGALEAGKFADMIATLANPLSDITGLERVYFVMKGGVVVKDEYKATIQAK